MRRHDNRLTPHLFMFCWGLLALLLLAGCATVEQEVTLYQDEAWKGSTRIGIVPELLSMSGGEEVFLAEFEQRKADAEAQGANVEWKRSQDADGVIYYTVEGSGTGYGLLNEIIFDGDAYIEPVVYDGQDAVQFYYFANSELAEYKLRLRAGEILSSDGVQEGKGDVTWQGTAMEMNAVLLPKSSSPLAPVLIGVTALVLIVAAVLFYQAWARQKARRTALASAYPQALSYPVQPLTSEGAVFCEHCGKKIEVAGKFCPHCGAPRP